MSIKPHHCDFEGCEKKFKIAGYLHLWKFKTPTLYIIFLYFSCLFWFIFFWTLINPFEQYNNWVGLDDRLKSDKQLHELLESYKGVKSIKKRRSMRKLLFAEMETRF